MSRESLLDEAIAKAKEAEDWQLVEWLRMVRGGESAAKWYTAKFDQLKAENAKLRESAKAAWILFLKHGAVGQHELPEVDRVRESLNELGIKVSWEELGIEENE